MLIGLNANTYGTWDVLIYSEHPADNPGATSFITA
jgi:hypothetical protein